MIIGVVVFAQTARKSEQIPNRLVGIQLRQLFRISLLVTLIGVFFAAGQENKKPRNESEKLSPAEPTEKDPARIQAIASIKTTALQAGTLADKTQTADVIAAAAEALRNADRQFSINTVNEHLGRFLNEYESFIKDCPRSTDSLKTCQELDRASKILISCLSRFDPKAARTYQDRLFKVRESAAASGSRNTNEAFELMLNGLDSDQQATLRSIGLILQRGVPSQFPAIVYRLRSSNPVTAGLLLDLAISNVAPNSSYSLTDVITLSTAVYSEPGLLEPQLRDPAQPNDLGVFTAYVGIAPEHATAESILRFNAGTAQLLSRQLQGDRAIVFNSPANLIKAFFICHKIRAYANIWGFASPVNLDSVLAEITSRMQTAGFSPQTMEAVLGYANRIATANNPLQLSEGDDLLELAENEKDPDKKLDYLIRAVVRLVESKKFPEAERLIFDISKTDVRDALYLFTYFRSAIARADSGDMLGFDRQVNQVSDKTVRSFLLLHALEKPAFSEFDWNMIKNKSSTAIDEISDPEAKASASVTLLEKLLESQPDEAQHYVPTMLRNVNAAPTYYQQPFRTTIKIPNFSADFIETTGSGSFRKALKKMASLNWTEAQILAAQFKAKPLELLARVVTADAFLNARESAAVTGNTCLRGNL